MLLKIIKAEVLRFGHGQDRITLYTELPADIGSEEPLSLDFKVRRWDGLAYLNKHFPGVPTQVYEYLGVRTSFSGETE